MYGSLGNRGVRSGTGTWWEWLISIGDISQVALPKDARGTRMPTGVPRGSIWTLSGCHETSRIRLDFSVHSLLLYEASSAVESEILLYLPANKLVCPGFMDVGRKRDTPGSATKDFVIPGIATSMSFVFVSSPPALALTGQCKGGHVTHTQVVGYVTEEEADFSC